MTTPRNDIVRLRLTTLEKQDWVKAAGGAKKLSEWIRSVCNAAALEGRGAGSLPGDVETPPASSAVPNAKPKIVGDAIERAVSRGGEQERDDSTGHTSGDETPAVAPPAQCARWMYHRPGVYCGACKRVIQKR